MSKNNTGKEIESSNYFMKIVDWLACTSLYIVFTCIILNFVMIKKFR